MWYHRSAVWTAVCSAVAILINDLDNPLPAYMLYSVLLGWLLFGPILYSRYFKRHAAHQTEQEEANNKHEVEYQAYGSDYTSKELEDQAPPAQPQADPKPPNRRDSNAERQV